MERREVLKLRSYRWEPATSELCVVPATYWPAPALKHDPETVACETMRKRVETFITSVERDI